MRYIKFLVVPLLFVTLAFMTIGGCSGNSSGGNNKGCCVIDGGPLCFEDFNKDECNLLDGDLKKGKICENVPACDAPVEGCCVIGEGNCVEDQTQLECDIEGGVLDTEFFCDDIMTCEPLVDAGCCEIEPGNCSESLGIEGCADEGGMFTPDVMCSTIETCDVVPPPLDGAILYDGNCAGCHGPDGVGGFAGDVVGATAEQIDAAIIGEPSMNSLESLSPAEIDAIADFLDM